MNYQSIVNRHIKPALEKTFRWQGMSEDELKKYEKPIKENVWEHTQSCLKRAEELAKDYPEILEFIDYEKLKLIILFHDAPEGFAKHGDVTQYDPDREKKKAENNESEVFKNILVRKFGIDISIFNLYEEYEAKSNIESVVAKLIDRMDARDLWWRNLKESYRNNFLSTEKDFGLKMIEYSEFVKDKLQAINALNPRLMEMLNSFIADLLQQEVLLLPTELQESQRTAIIEARNHLVSES